MTNDSPLELTEALIGIDSVNPELVPGAPGEAEIARFVADWGERAGLEVARIDEPTGRPSVVLVARGRRGGRSLMLNAHLDTVGVGGMEAPFSPRRANGRLYGRGACDTKGGLAAAMVALRRAARQRLSGNLLLAAVADEEHGSAGTRAVLRRFGADAAVVLEPTNLELCVAHRGFALFEVETRGRAAHTSQPDAGVNAVAHMGVVLDEIARLQRGLGQGPSHALLGQGCAQVVAIEGGGELFVTPSRCRLRYERRTLPGEDASVARGELDEVLARAQRRQSLRVDRRLLLAREPFEVSPDAEILRQLGAQLRTVLGGAPRVSGAAYWTDAALIAAAGIPAVVFGPVGGGLHATEEWLEIDSVERCQRALSAVAAAFCA